MALLELNCHNMDDSRFALRVNGKAYSLGGKDAEITLNLPENSDFTVEIVQKPPESNHRLHKAIASVLFSVLKALVCIILFQDSLDEIIEDIEPYLLRSTLRGNTRDHSELNLYYIKSRNIDGDYTRPRIDCSELNPAETLYFNNVTDIKNKFFKYALGVFSNVLILIILFTIILIAGLNPFNAVQVWVSAALLAASLALGAFLLINKHRKWFKNRTKEGAG